MEIQYIISLSTGEARTMWLRLTKDHQYKSCMMVFGLTLNKWCGEVEERRGGGEI